MDYPPDDLTLSVKEWLKNEIYPGLLQEPWTDRADAVWVSGSGGWIGLWASGLGSHLPPLERMEFIKHELFRRIERVKFRPPVTPALISGQLRVEGLGFRDDNGPVKPLLCHFGEAFSAFVRRPEAVLKELDLIRSAGYHGIRFWDVLGFYDQNRPGDPNPWTAWAGREVTPIGFRQFSGAWVEPTPLYYERLAEFLGELAQRGLVAHHSRGDLNTWPWDQILMHCRRVGEIQRSVGASTIALNESLNEAFQNGVPEEGRLKEMGLALGDHAIRGTSSGDDGYGGETPDELNRLKWDVAIIHGFRGGDTHNRIGHIHAVGYETLPHSGVPGWQGEPAGPGSGVSVGREESEEGLILMAGMAHLTHQAWVFMSGYGVFWDGSIGNMKGFWAVPKILDLLPPDIMQWPEIIHGGERWRGKRIFVAPPDGSLRCDFALKGEEFVGMIYGRPGRHDVPVEKRCQIEIIHPVSGVVEEMQVNPGDVLELDFERGRIIRGKLF